MAKIFISFNVITASDIILVVRENSNLAAEVFRQFYAAPHTTRNLTVDPVNPVMHRVQIWSTTDGTTLGTLKGACDIDASIATNTAFHTFDFVVDNGRGAPNYDPVSNQGAYVNTDLAGKTYTVFQSGFGPLIPGRHIDYDVAGGFHYIDGQLFSTGGEYTIMVSDLIQTNAASTGKSYPDGIVEVTANINFGSTHYNKLLEVNAGANIVITIPDITLVPDGTLFGINTHNGTQKYVTLQLPVGAYCLINGIQRNAVYVGRAEEVMFIKKAGYLRIVGWDGDYRRVGDRVMKDGIPPWNSLPEIGGWVLKSEYLRIWHWYVNELPASPVNYFNDPAEATPSALNKAYWGKGTTKFWVPDTRNMFARASDGTRAPGNFQDQDNSPHSHPSGTQVDASNPVENLAAAHPVRSWSSGPQIDAGATASTLLSTGEETRPKNIATLIYRII